MKAYRGAWRRRTDGPRVLRGGSATLVTGGAWTGAEPILADGAGGPVGRMPEPGGGALALRVRFGGCLCGAVRFELRGEPMRVGLCHCEDCRKASGGLALHFADWPRAALRLTGELRSHAGRSFCPCCGGRVAHLSPEVAQINLGALDDPPNDLVPDHEIWTVRREPWLPPVPGAQQWPRDPT